MSATKPTAMNTRSPTIKRILREAAELSGSPSPDYTAQPLESDLFEWHFTLRGPPNSVYSEGRYHGRIILPPTYPLRPPMFRFSTPNGRFEANREICLSISGHHEETWQPAWGIRTALVALRSFMETEAGGQLGGLDTTDEVRKRFATESGSWRCPTCQLSNAEIIKDCEEKSQQSLSKESEVSIPQELKLAWKDQLSDDSPAVNDPSKASDGVELAEGFVQTVPAHETSPTPQQRSQTAAREPVASNLPRNELHLDLHQPPLQRQHLDLPQAARRTVQEDDEGTPLWIDRAIVVLVVLLAALLIKVLLDL